MLLKNQKKKKRRSEKRCTSIVCVFSCVCVCVRCEFEMHNLFNGPARPNATIANPFAADE